MTPNFYEKAKAGSVHVRVFAEVEPTFQSQ